MENSTQTAFLFDLDGVIIDSENMYTEIWTRIGERYPTGVDNFARVIKGMTLGEILAQYFPDEDTRRMAEQMLYDEESHMRYRYVPGADDLLERLRQKGIPCALVTSSNSIKMERLWKQMPELKKRFQTVITGDDVSKSKPDPEGYISAAYRLDTQPLRCAVVEDSIQGVKAGRLSGAYVIGLPGTNTAEALAPYCDLIVESLDHIDVDIIDSMLRVRG